MTDRLWSVTTITKEGLPAPALQHWAANTTAEWAVDHLAALNALMQDGSADREAAVELVKKARYRSSGKAALRGTRVHNLAEKRAYGEEPLQVDPSVVPYLDQYDRFLADHRPQFEMAEAPVYNLRYHYAGTLDAIVRFPASALVGPMLLDMKTTDKHPNVLEEGGSRPPYPDIALQLVAYRMAELVGVGPAHMTTWGGRRYYQFPGEEGCVPMPETAGALALVVSPYDYTLTPVRTDDEVWETFLYVREVARWSLDISQRVLGPQIAPAKEVEA